MFKMAITVSVLITSIMVISFTAHAQDIRIVFNGQQVEMDVPPIMRDGRTLVSLRPIAEAYGYRVYWYEYYQFIEMVLGTSMTIGMWIDEPVAVYQSLHMAEENVIAIDVPPTIINGRIFVPIRFVTEMLGTPVTWDDDTRTIYIGLQHVPEAEYVPTPTPTPEPVRRTTPPEGWVQVIIMSPEQLQGAWRAEAEGRIVRVYQPDGRFRFYRPPSQTNPPQPTPSERTVEELRSELPLWNRQDVVTPQELSRMLAFEAQGYARNVNGRWYLHRDRMVVRERVHSVHDISR